MGGRTLVRAHFWDVDSTYTLLVKTVVLFSKFTFSLLDDWQSKALVASGCCDIFVMRRLWTGAVGDMRLVPLDDLFP